MADFEETKVEEVSEGAALKEQRKTNRIFGLFLILSIFLVAFIVIEIVLLAQ